MNISVFLGAPGSGKGTQAKHLAEKQGFTHFSTGDILRASIKQQKPVGLKAKAFMDKGELVPDNVMIELIEDALKPLGSNAKVILDGFPRTVPQAEALDSKANTTVSKAIYFIVPEKALMARLTGRRVCPNCGESFHLIFVPPQKEGVCDKCQTALIQRTDDTEAVVVKRLEVFRAQNQGLLDYYSKNHKLKEMQADKPVEAIESVLLSLLS